MLVKLPGFLVESNFIDVLFPDVQNVCGIFA